MKGGSDRYSHTRRSVLLTFIPKSNEPPRSAASRNMRISSAVGGRYRSALPLPLAGFDGPAAASSSISSKAAEASSPSSTSPLASSESSSSPSLPSSSIMSSSMAACIMARAWLAASTPAWAALACRLAAACPTGAGSPAFRLVAGMAAKSSVQCQGLNAGLYCAALF